MKVEKRCNQIQHDVTPINDILVVLKNMWIELYARDDVTRRHVLFQLNVYLSGQRHHMAGNDFG